MKVSQYAKNTGLCKATIYRLIKAGKLKHRRLPTGTIIIDAEKSSTKSEYTVVYARVSSSMNKSNLDTQSERVAAFCTAKGWVVNDVIKECASGLNDKRPKLQKILKSEKVTRIVVEHKDRLTRFGFEYIKTLFVGEIVVINEVNEDEKDLMQDFVSLSVTIN